MFRRLFRASRGTPRARAQFFEEGSKKSSVFVSTPLSKNLGEGWAQGSRAGVFN